MRVLRPRGMAHPRLVSISIALVLLGVLPSCAHGSAPPSDPLSLASPVATDTGTPTAEETPTGSPGAEESQSSQVSQVRYTVVATDELTRGEAKLVRAFIRFAVSPTPRQLAAVPFAEPIVTLVFGEQRQAATADLADTEEWMLSNDVGTGSALDSVSRELTLAEPGQQPIFLATTDGLVLCADGSDTLPTKQPGQLFVMVASSTTPPCAKGFRVTLGLDAGDAISTVRLALREP